MHAGHETAMESNADCDKFAIPFLVRVPTLKAAFQRASNCLYQTISDTLSFVTD